MPSATATQSPAYTPTPMHPPSSQDVHNLHQATISFPPPSHSPLLMILWWNSIPQVDLTSLPPPLPRTPQLSSLLNFLLLHLHLINLKVLPPPHYPIMSDDIHGNTNRLRIWQQNLNTSLIAQLSLLNTPTIANWDILVIQESHINFLHNTSANHHWHVIYPSQHLMHPQQ
ncbi:hypothetical protein BDR04DRAFT_1148881 [Suillus decipiens]|nr:hypothetical protein BDR04DRAFT_1148881 [Suillus decipiens]